MKKKLVLSLLVAAAPLVGCDKPSTEAPKPVPQAVAPSTPSGPAVEAETKLDSLTTADVEKRRKEPNFFVFDNNTKDRFDKGHVPGAKWVNPMELTAADLPADKAATLVFYCANTACSACHVGAKTALKLGYSKVYIMPDGIAGWETAKLPTEPAKA